MIFYFPFSKMKILIDIGLYQYGWENVNLPILSACRRNHYIFHYVISGTGTLMADDSSGNTIKYQVKSGQGFMLFPNQINTYIADQDLHGNIPGLNLTGSVPKRLSLLPDSVRIIRSIMPVRRIFAMK